MTITKDEFAELVQPLIGMPVTRPWKGYGSAAFLELGKLREETGRGGHSFKWGEASIMIEWDWRIEIDDEIVGGSSESRPRIEALLSGLRGLHVGGIELVGSPPELWLRFDDGSRLRSMAMLPTDPQWAIKLKDGRWLSFEDGRLVCNRSLAETSDEEQWTMGHADSTASRWCQSISTPGAKRCCDCRFLVLLDGDFALLDWGVCTSPDSQRDGRATHVHDGCSAFTPHSKSGDP